MHWFERPGTRICLKLAFVAALVAVVIAQLFVAVTAHFEPEAWLGFMPGLGLVACALAIAMARLFGRLFQRSEDYYEDAGD